MRTLGKASSLIGSSLSLPLFRLVVFFQTTTLPAAYVLCIFAGSYFNLHHHRIDQARLVGRAYSTGMLPGSNLSARDASGNQISLLNYDPVPQTKKRPILGEPIVTSAASYYPASTMTASYSSISLRSIATTSETPGLLRSDSYNS
jgi:hypothetical protein